MSRVCPKDGRKRGKCPDGHSCHDASRPKGLQWDRMAMLTWTPASSSRSEHQSWHASFRRRHHGRHLEREHLMEARIQSRFTARAFQATCTSVCIHVTRLVSAGRGSTIGRMGSLRTPGWKVPVVLHGPWFWRVGRSRWRNTGARSGRGLRSSLSAWGGDVGDDAGG